MKYLLFVFTLTCSWTYGQLTMEQARAANSTYHLGTYSYHEDFIGHAGYGAPVILTQDGGAALFGDGEDKGRGCGVLVKLNKSGKEEWKKCIPAQFDEMESQSVVQDKAGNFYVFILSYDHKRYRGGSERVLCLSKTGVILWDKTFGSYSLLNSPTVAYIKALDDGRIYLRGQTVTTQPPKGEDPKYLFWEGWLTSKGALTQKTGEVIDWGKGEWKQWFKPE